MYELDSTDLQFLPGMGPKRAAMLNTEVDIHTFRDLLYYFPYKYIDRSKIYTISEITSAVPYIQLKGKIISYKLIGGGRAQRLSARFIDSTGEIELIWFQKIKFIPDQYKVGNEYILFGKPSFFGQKVSIVHPELDKLDGAVGKVVGGLSPYYNTTEKMKNNYLNSKAIQKLMVGLFEKVSFPIAETLPAYLLTQLNLMNLTEALRNIHFPKNNQLLEQARYRMKFEELLYIQLDIVRKKKHRHQKLQGYKFTKVGKPFNDFYKNNLPFELTGAQKRVIKEIYADMCSGHQMNRLLQGDVGSGKTLVALLCMLLALGNDFQACIMAPTEILATQHYETMKKQLEGLNIRVELLTGSTKKKDRVPLLEDLKMGKIHILVGTHALLEESVQFNNLGLVVIDEQHRFGVVQRAKLWRKNEQFPHVLVMTATPIPRTLAMTVYGDLEVSVIDELPPGRKPIRTMHVFDGKRGQLMDFVRKEISLGRQIYIVYPLIQESEKVDLKCLEEGYNQIKEIFKDVEVGMVHGKLKPKDKDAEMERFKNAETKILVATTVIEVGVNVPNASVMIIENAERFGLAQLHQLRGRVGRGCDQSYCILVTSPKLGEDGRKRMDIMVNSTDGFEIAEADMKLRGFGDIDGTQQSGESFNFRIANIARDGQLLEYTRGIAEKILEKDPELKSEVNGILSRNLQKMVVGKGNWGLIS